MFQESVNTEPPPFSLYGEAKLGSTDKMVDRFIGENLIGRQATAERGADTHKDSTSYYPRMAFESFTGDPVKI